ncbi:MAG TPA: hypothetical protein VGG61_15080 [Gemmataceae bacterium]|jgi:hypothetical protein
MLRWTLGATLAALLVFGGFSPLNASSFDDEADPGLSLVKGGKGKGKKKGGKKKGGKKKAAKKVSASA